MTEEDFLRRVIETARWAGWLVYHPEKVPARWRGETRWVTAGSDGFPDLVLVHPKRGLIFAELKTDRGRVADSQRRWHDALSDASVEVYVWRPIDWDAIVRRLTTPVSAARITETTTEGIE